jgi:hypothetical protein
MIAGWLLSIALSVNQAAPAPSVEALPNREKLGVARCGLVSDTHENPSGVRQSE